MTLNVSCSNVDAESIVAVGSDLFQHVHKDEGSVYDFTDWVLQHPGGAAKIKQFTGMGYKLIYPSWHPMERWDASFATQVIQPQYVGQVRQSCAVPQPPCHLADRRDRTGLGCCLGGHGILGRVRLTTGGGQRPGHGTSASPSSTAGPTIYISTRSITSGGIGTDAPSK